MRNYAILAPGEFERNAKTAHGVIRYSSDRTVAVIDPACSQRTVRDVVPHLQSGAPIVASVDEALAFEPDSLLVGTAPQGGKLPAPWRAQIRRAIEAGLDVVSGLHDILGEDPEFSRLAREGGVCIWDVRKPPDVPLFSGAVYDVAAPVLLTVGNDCAVGKMTVTIELARAARESGRSAEFVPTGQTGIMIAGWGIAVDRVISDFAPGAAEQLVMEAARRDPQFILVEGQGAINHPAYAPVTLSLLFGCAPDALLLVADPKRTHIESYHAPTLGYSDLIELHETLCATVKPAKVLGIALNTRGLSDVMARDEIARAAGETGLPADDVVRNGPAGLWNAILPRLRKATALRAEVRT